MNSRCQGGLSFPRSKWDCHCYCKACFYSFCCLSSKSPKPETQKEKGKKPRVWDLGNSNAKVLDYSNSTTNGNTETCPAEEFDPDMVRSLHSPSSEKVWPWSIVVLDLLWTSWESKPLQGENIQSWIKLWAVAGQAKVSGIQLRFCSGSAGL